MCIRANDLKKDKVVNHKVNRGSGLENLPTQKIMAGICSVPGNVQCLHICKCCSQSMITFYSVQ